MELSGGSPNHNLRELLQNALEIAFGEGVAIDAVIADNVAQHQSFWHVRESIPEALDRVGICIPCDVSVPVSSIPDFIPAAIVAVTECCPGIRVAPFGHVGDGNIHFDLVQPEAMGDKPFLARWHQITRSVYDVVRLFGGSFSAEHGTGQLKIEDMRRYQAPVDLDMLRTIKRGFDPKGLMNPGKVVPNA